MDGVFIEFDVAVKLYEELYEKEDISPLTVWRIRDILDEASVRIAHKHGQGVLEEAIDELSQNPHGHYVSRGFQTRP